MGPLNRILLKVRLSQSPSLFVSGRKQNISSSRFALEKNFELDLKEGTDFSSDYSFESELCSLELNTEKLTDTNSRVVVQEIS